MIVLSHKMADILGKSDADSEAQKSDTRQLLLVEQCPDQLHPGPVPIPSSSSSSVGPLPNSQDGPIVVSDEILREQADAECVGDAFICEMNMDLFQSLTNDPAAFDADCFVLNVVYDILGDSSPASNMDGNTFSATRTIVCGKAASLYSVCEFVQGLFINDPYEISTVVSSEKHAPNKFSISSPVTCGAFVAVSRLQVLPRSRGRSWTFVILLSAFWESTPTTISCRQSTHCTHTPCSMA